MGLKMGKRRKANKRKHRIRKKEVPRCKICGGPLIAIDEWKERYYWKILRGELPKPEYFDEIQAAFQGEKPPADACDYIAEDRRLKQRKNRPFRSEEGLGGEHKNA